MAGYYRQVADTLKAAGWFLHHEGKGSHEVWRHRDDPEGGEISVPANLKKRYTAEAIMKQAGLPKDAFAKSGKRSKRRRA